jgi:hypothetical protein
LLSVQHDTPVDFRFNNPRTHHSALPLLSLASFRARSFCAVFEYHRVGPCDRSPATTRKLTPKASSFETWAKANADKLKAAWFKE